MSPDGRRLAWIQRFGAESMGDLVFRVLTGGVAGTVVAVFLYLVVLLTRDAWGSISAFGLGFLTSQAWDPPNQVFGGLAYIYGTVASSVLALVLAVPVAIGTGLALVDVLPRRVAGPLGMFIELLAAVPSIVFGIWGLTVIVPLVRRVGPDGASGRSLLAGSIVLAAMILPYIASISREMIRAVPRHQREAALALGATPWEVTWRVVLPSARAGIFAAVVIGLGRAIGETMAVVMVIGLQARIHLDPFQPAYTIASLIANEFGDPSGPLQHAALVELGLVLLAVSLALNLVARLVVRSFTRRMGAPT